MYYHFEHFQTRTLRTCSGLRNHIHFGQSWELSQFLFLFSSPEAYLKWVQNWCLLCNAVLLQSLWSNYFSITGNSWLTLLLLPTSWHAIISPSEVLNATENWWFGYLQIFFPCIGFHHTSISASCRRECSNLFLFPSCLEWGWGDVCYSRNLWLKGPRELTPHDRPNHLMLYADTHKDDFINKWRRCQNYLCY